MNRKTSEKNIKELIKNIRTKIPDVVLRTSLIVGFPGETQEDFDKLYKFVSEAKFDKLGVFMYSKEEGTPAAKMIEQIHHMTKKSRYNKIMKKQQVISKENLEKRISAKTEVLIENMTFDKKYFVGRTKQDVPDMDGLVYIKNTDELKEKNILSNIIKCKIININNYDIIAEIC